MKRLHTNIIAAAVLCGILITPVIGAAPDNFKHLVPAAHIIYNGSGTPASAIGGFCYIPTTGRFYTSTYGSGRGIRVFVGNNEEFPVWPAPFAPENPLQTADGRSWHCDTDSDLTRVMGATSFENGTMNPLTHLLNGFTVNPKTVVYNGRTYGPYELAVLSNNTNSGTVSVNKRLLTWDFREIWSPTSKQPDRANAEYAPGYLEIDRYGVEYGYGCTNWNDAFDSLMTFGQMAAAIGASVSAPVTTDQVGGRRAVFSADGAKVYFVSADMRSSGRLFTGVWSVELATKTVKRLLDDTAYKIQRPIAEPASVAIGVRNFTGQNYADHINQVLFNGTDASGNIGGINALVDDGSAVPGIYPAVPAEAMLDFLGMAPDTPLDSRPGYMSITADKEGNLYLYTNSPYSALYKYDTQGRLLCIANRLEHYAFNTEVLGSTSTNTAYLRLDVREVIDPNTPDTPIVQLMFMSTAGKCVAGVNAYKPMDFRRDGVISVADTNFFKAQLQKTWNSMDPNVPSGSQDYLDYIQADLNGDGEFVTIDGIKVIEKPCVTEKDREIFWQFVLPGDANFDHVVDLSDFADLAANYGETGKDWSQGDFDFDDDVDMDDFILLTKNWLKHYD